MTPDNGAASARERIAALAQLQSEHIHVRQERCLLVRNRNASCMRCAQACTSACISWDEKPGTFLIDQSRCVGCGTCATVCPTCALEARRPNDAELLNQLRESLESAGDTARAPLIACEEAEDGAASSPVRVKCLSRIDESAILQLAACGADEVVLACGSCEACSKKPGGAVAEEVCRTANLLLELWGSRARATLRRVPKPHRDSAPQSDRDVTDEVFNDQRPNLVTAPDVADASQHETGSAPRKRFKVMADGTLPHFIPDRRERLLDALAALGPGPSESDAKVVTRLWGHVVIDLDKCTSCRMCATFCPTGAIVKFDKDDGTFGIDHYASDCVQCRCCENVCRAHAVTVEDATDARTLVNAVAERHIMRPVRTPKGGVHSIMNSMRELLGMPEVFER